jgi:hypothetical protein
LDFFFQSLHFPLNLCYFPKIFPKRITKLQEIAIKIFKKNWLGAEGGPPPPPAAP